MSNFGVPPMAPPPDLLPGVPIQQDTACRKCGYNLRGLDVGGRCPECGTAVGYSLQGDLLRFCDPAWVETLARGAKLFIWGIVVIILGAVGAGTLAFTLGEETGSLVGAAATVGGWILTSIGWWLMTEPDPSGLGEDKYGTSRKIIRIALMVSVAEQVLDQLPLLVRYEPAALLAIRVASGVLALVAIVGFFAQLNYLKRLALRIPNPRLSGRAHFLMFAFPITYGILIVVGLIALLIMRTPRGAAAGGGLAAVLAVVGVFAAVVGLAVLVFGIMYLMLVEKMGKAFREQARVARNSWAAGGVVGQTA